jgi:hypothetical protein
MTRDNSYRNMDLMSEFTSRRGMTYTIQNPHNYSVFTTTAGLQFNLSPGREQRLVKSFMVQSSLDNTDWIRVGENASLLNGIMLDPGGAWEFSVDVRRRTGSLMNGPGGFAETLRRGEEGEDDAVLNIADYLCCARADNQELIIYWSSNI